MRQNYTFSLKALTFVFALLFISTAASAYTQAYCWWYTRAMVFPEGAGTVFTCQMGANDGITYEAVSDCKYNVYFFKEYAYKYFYFYSQPNDGYIFLGWKKLDKNYWVELETNPNAQMKDFLAAEYESNSEIASFYLETTQFSDSEDDVNYSKYPDYTYVAVFGSFGLKYIPGQESLGTMSVDDPDVEIGGSTQVNATPADGAEFLYWVDEEGNKVSDENPYTVEVTRSGYLSPVFSAPGYITMDFGKGSYKLIGTSDKSYFVPSGFCFYMVTPLVENTYIDSDGNVQKYTVSPNHFADSTAHILGAYQRSYALYQGNAGLFYGKGLGTFQVEPAAYPSLITDNMLISTGSDTVDIAKLSHDGMKYYVFDGKNKFIQTADAVLPPDSAYLAIAADYEGYKFSEFTVMQPDEYEAFMQGEGQNIVYLTAERKIGQGSTATEIAYDEEAILKKLGIASVSEDNVFPINATTGEAVKDWKQYDGWFDASGDATADNKFVRLQYPHDGKLLLSTSADNEPADGSGFMAQWAICSATDTVILHVDASFVEHESVKFSICDTIVKASTTYYTMSQDFGDDYEGEEDPYTYTDYMEHSVTLTADQADLIKAELGIDDLSAVEIKGYNLQTEKILNDVSVYDGWRNSYGDFASWTYNASSPISVKAVDATHYLTYNLASVTTGDYKAYWALVANRKAVLVEITVSHVYSLPTAIADVKDESATTDEIFDLAGRRINRISSPGIYIRGGKKILVK